MFLQGNKRAGKVKASGSICFGSLTDKSDSLEEVRVDNYLILNCRLVGLGS